jgi:hypothetical protein
MRIYYRWQVTTLTQERFYTSIAIAGFLCLAVAAVFLRDLLACDRALVRIGSFTIGAGALLWITGAGMLAFAVTAAHEHAAYRMGRLYDRRRADAADPGLVICRRKRQPLGPAADR